MKLGVDLKTNYSMQLVSWKSSTNPSPGFENAKKGSSGCERTKSLSCSSNQFAKLHNMKLTDTDNATANPSKGLDECKYILLGISDVFTVGMQEFFYVEVPTTMRTIGIALYLSVFGVGSFLSAILISVLELVSNASGKQHSWFFDDASEARLDNYYWFLALLSSIRFFIFAYLCKYYNSANASKN
ncbi:hypothetical protein Cni_G00753 [Canna indica]|uniref:Uncharacterized protein n=1 Tax=Canna indica TaxID=4628 RepID=A0AAQ3Q0W7_9LILI|nr:hypothetical protein Cni_G00753 [Canna indica]